MSSRSQSYDQAYRDVPALFGTGPAPLLEARWRGIDTSKPVLDLGCGQGRNSLFLAERGHSVHALDPSEVAIATVRERAATLGLAIRTFRCGFEEHAAAPGAYAAVLLFGIVQVLTPEETAALGACIERWLVPGGLLLVTAFTTLDPAYGRMARSSVPIGPHSFRRREGQIRSYVQPGELPTLFPGLVTAHLVEAFGPWHQHGRGERERHHAAAAVMRRP